jgi:hypothetical protein
MARLGRLFAGHCTAVESLHSLKRSLYSVGAVDGVTYRWTFEQDEAHWDLSYTEHEANPFDEFIIRPREIELAKKVTIPLREDAYQPVDLPEPGFRLAFRNVVGRSAHNRTSNLFYDS